MHTFKPGDKVYFPRISTEVLTICENTHGQAGYPVAIRDYIFTQEGKLFVDNELPVIFHATKERQAQLEALHGVKFESAPLQSTSHQIVRAMLARGDKSIACWVSDIYSSPSPTNAWSFIRSIDEDGFFVDPGGAVWRYATPFNHLTDQPITELPKVKLES